MFLDRWQRKIRGRWRKVGAGDIDPAQWSERTRSRLGISRQLAGRGDLRILFDRSWYLRRHPDVARSGQNPLIHFLQKGWREGYDPHPLFDTRWYLERYPDVATSGLNPLIHFLEAGWRAGYDPHPIFDTSWYLERHPGVAETGVNPLVHYLTVGHAERLDPSPRFSTAWYLDTYPDVPAAGINPLYHFVAYGRAEGRSALGGTYQDWVRIYDSPDEADLARLRRRLADIGNPRRLSLVIPVSEPRDPLLRRTVESLRRQVYPDWDVAFAVSSRGDEEAGVRDLVDGFPSDRAEIVRADGADGDAADGVNQAVERASGEFVALVRPGDVLPPHALFCVADTLDRHPDAAIVYSDEDRIDAAGVRHDPFFKCVFNPALMLSINMLENLTFYRRDLLRKVGGVRPGFSDGVAYDLALRCVEEVDAARIRHVPRVLYHARAASPDPSAGDGDASVATLNRLRALDEHVRRTGLDASTRAIGPDLFQVSPRFTGAAPRISILMPSACKIEVIEPNVTKLLEMTTYPDYELILIVSDIRLKDPDKKRFLETLAEHPRVRLHVYQDRDFNFSWINNAGEEDATGSVLCFMNDDVEVTQPDWLDRLVARLKLDRVAAVGMLMYYPDGTIQHAGVTVGLGGAAGHHFRGFPADCVGLGGRACLEQDLSAVTAACMVAWRSIFHEVRRYDLELAVAFNDVDLCLKFRDRGYRVLFTPDVLMYHHESASLGNHASKEREREYLREVAYLQEKWGNRLRNDPFYSPNLARGGTDCELAFPPYVPELW